ncbi:MAG TPA: YhjD/YihY/BrkB family envelope integrity protein, partial [Thermoanaerobaculia bacterium]|nr:YhjD/YihY/BrkB family envelope integrity protein [Thermoanaerobaculia bacterium]
MPSNSNSLWYVLRETLANWSKHDASTHSAALAFSALFAIAPILILVVSISGWAFGVQAAQGQVQRDLSLFI